MQTAALSQRVRVGWWPRAVTAGFIAAIAMLLTFVVAFAIAHALAASPIWSRLGLMDVPGWLAGLARNPLVDLAGAGLYAIAGLHFFVAIVWGLVYALAVEPRLLGPGWRRGAVFSLIPWLISILVLLPLAGGGVLGMELGAGPLPILGNLVLHLVFGITLGALYGPLGDRPADTFPRTGIGDDEATVYRSEVRTAEGIIAGLLGGLALGALVTWALAAPSEATILGTPRAAFMLGTCLLGGAVGGLLGSFTGLSASR